MTARRETIKATIDPLNSVECNNHLLVFVLDAVLLVLFPEMGLDAEASTGGVFETPASTPYDTTP
jgi:hypothetical protein